MNRCSLASETIAANDVEASSTRAATASKSIKHDTNADCCCFPACMSTGSLAHIVLSAEYASCGLEPKRTYRTHS